MVLGRFVVGSVIATLFALPIAGCSSSSEEENDDAALSQGDQVYDTIIIGAGVAGLTAARELTKAHRSFLVLEAQDRIGGRAFVETKRFSVPIDYGAAWLHGVNVNPLVAVADGLGFHRADTNLEGPIYVGDHIATEAEANACKATAEELETKMAEVSQRGEDPAVSTLLPANAACGDLMGDNVGRFESGAEIEATGAIDSAAFESGDDDFIREGIGTFVAAYGKDVPVRLKSEVKKVAYGKPDDVVVTIATNETFHARRVLSTVSNGVLAAGKITFDPPLPAWKQDAIKALPMGVLDKVVFEFESDIFGSTPESSWVLWDGPGHDNMAFVIKPLGAPIAVGFYGGNQAIEWEKNPPAALSHAKDVLRQMFGAAVDTKLKTTAQTNWSTTPWTLGSYSAAVPGGSKMHPEMAKPVDDRLFFAGEACGSSRFNGSLAAAYESGMAASAAIVKSLTAGATAN